MATAIETLRRILKIEQVRDYSDRAVIGGLDKYLRRWAGLATEGITIPRLLRRFQELQLTQPHYASWNKSQRQEWVKKVLDWLEEVEASPHQPEKKVPVREKSPIKRPTTPPITPSRYSITLDSPITAMRGVSTGITTKLRRLGVSTFRELLYFFPRRHLDYSQMSTISQLKEEVEQSLVATVWEAQEKLLGTRRGTEATVGDATGNMRVVWFNQPYLARRLRTNDQIVLSGKVSLFKGQKVFESPEWEYLEEGELLHTGRLVPLYPLTEGLYPRQVRRLAKEALDMWEGQITDFLPQEIRDRWELMYLPQALCQAHYPDSTQMKDKARERLAFDELFLLQLGVLSKKRQWQESQPSPNIKAQPQLLESFLSSLPFHLTPAQERVLGEILTDLEKSQPMSRLLQGEVGSGKTVVATAALLLAAANGYQAALMAPTEILAEQHFHNIRTLLQGLPQPQQGEHHFSSYLDPLPHPIAVALLTGSLAPSEKGNLHQLIAEGGIDIVIGTHALIQKDVDFPRLGLAVVDEQHRFGVRQRLALRQKGFSPHILVMTATPIPRTLALTLYGDLDLSVIDQLPPGRQAVKTHWLAPEQREKAYSFLRRQVAAERQAFIVCPLIEESESIEARAAVAEYQRLSQEVFPDLRLGLLHGRMGAEEKEETMHRFRARELDILVSTPVVEVGIDVPNATVMLVEGADRFGLSQLHQFRGRVGRGSEQSYCLLLAESPSPEGRERLALIEQIQDGFLLAEEDLRLRGPGEFFGTRQSGLPDLKMAKLSDLALLERARKEAEELFRQDLDLKLPRHRLLAQELARLWQNALSEIS